MPEGVYLRPIRQRGLTVNVQGYSQSNARVSTLMRNNESSPWLASPQLIEIKAARVGSKRLSEFNMNLQLKRVQLKEAPKDAAKAPAKKG
jgi:type IV pilus assembly protein PilN